MGTVLGKRHQERSWVYPIIIYLVTLRETTLAGRKTMLCNIASRRQLRAISSVQVY